MSQNKKDKICFICKGKGFDKIVIDFEKIGEDETGKAKWKLLEPNGTPHKHVSNQQEYEALMAARQTGQAPKTEPPEGQSQLQTTYSNLAFDILWIKKEMNEFHRKMNLCMDALNIDPEEITPPNNPNSPSNAEDT